MIRQLHRDEHGVTVIEFAMIAPVFLTLLVSMFDLGQMAYGISVLNGAVQKAARDSSLEVNDIATIDRMVANQVTPVLPGAKLTSSRKSYVDFTDIGRAEKWNDANNNGECDNNEAYVDENGSGDWNKDVGKDGNGGAEDVVLYRVDVSYEPTFKVPFLPDSWKKRTLTASAIKKNQPFASQQGYGSNAGVCS